MVKTKDNNDGWVAEESRTLRVKFVGKGYLAWEKLSVVPQIRYKVIEKGVSMNKGLNKEMNVTVKLSTTKGDSSGKEKLERIASTTSKGIMGEAFRQRPTIVTSKMGENAMLSQESGEDVVKAGAMETVTPLPSLIVGPKLQSATFKVETEHI
ncbi:hypothetical protein Gotur_029075 [Gossypium turneri]